MAYARDSCPITRPEFHAVTETLDKTFSLTCVGPRGL
jgi:hypothetical protein